MDPMAWTVLGTGVAILIALAGALRAIRIEIREQRKELTERIGALKTQMHRVEIELRERMAKVEGLLEGLREAITGQRAV